MLGAILGPDIWSSVEMKLDWKFRNVIKLFAERYNV